MFNKVELNDFPQITAFKKAFFMYAARLDFPIKDINIFAHLPESKDQEIPIFLSIPDENLRKLFNAFIRSFGIIYFDNESIELDLFLKLLTMTKSLTNQDELWLNPRELFHQLYETQMEKSQEATSSNISTESLTETIGNKKALFEQYLDTLARKFHMQSYKTDSLITDRVINTNNKQLNVTWSFINANAYQLFVKFLEKHQIKDAAFNQQTLSISLDLTNLTKLFSQTKIIAENVTDSFRLNFFDLQPTTTVQPLPTIKPVNAHFSFFKPNSTSITTTPSIEQNMMLTLLTKKADPKVFEFYALIKDFQKTLIDFGRQDGATAKLYSPMELCLGKVIDQCAAGKILSLEDIKKASDNINKVSLDVRPSIPDREAFASLREFMYDITRQLHTMNEAFQHQASSSAPQLKL